jgi:hypothetical protein
MAGMNEAWVARYGIVPTRRGRLQKRSKMFLTWTVLISWPPARLSKVFAPFCSKSGCVLAALQTE